MIIIIMGAFSLNQYTCTVPTPKPLRIYKHHYHILYNPTQTQYITSSLKHTTSKPALNKAISKTKKSWC